MTRTVFFSWQADCPARNTIERALQNAIKDINADLSLKSADREALAIDSDTRDVGGTPPIVETIFRKIDEATVFVADLTLVSLRFDNKRRAPNPNVLLEFGWALKSLGYERVTGVANSHYNHADSGFPFDLAHLRRPFSFHLAPDDSEVEKQYIHKQLRHFFVKALKLILKSSELSSKTSLPVSVDFIPQATSGKISRFCKAHEPIGVVHNPFNPNPPKIFMRDGAAMWLRVMPKHVLAQDFDVVSKRTKISTDLLPLGSFQMGGHSNFRAINGYGTFCALDDQGRTESMALLFETGEIWAINTLIMRHHLFIPSRKIIL